MTSPGVWPTKEELKGEAWLGEDPPPPVAHDNYPTAELFASEIEATFYEERALDMVDGPFTRLEAAERCRCKPEELCPGPLAGIDESDKIRTIYDGSKGGANAHIQAHTEEKTTAPMVGDCLHAIHWLRTAADHPHLLRAPLSGTEERHRDGHSPGAEGPERDPHSTNLPPRAEGPERGRGTMETSDGTYLRGRHRQGRGHSQVPRALIGGPHSPQPFWHGTPGGKQGGTPDVAAADTWGNIHHPQGGCHQGPQAYQSAPERLEIPGGLHPEPVVGQQSGHVRHGLGTTVLGKKGILGAQAVLHLPSGGLAFSLCGRLLLGPQMQPGGMGRHSHPGYSAGAGSPAFLEENGALPDQYLVGICGGPNHALCTAGSSQACHNPGHS